VVGHDGGVIVDAEQCYRAVVAKDARFDGCFVTAVTSTGIYCRPSCPAITPKRTNVRFYPTAAAAQQGGFRACKRCRPDASPGSPEWHRRDDVVARAMRLIGDGVVERDGVRGLAARLGYSERHLNRLLSDAVGAGPLALARAQRAVTARALIEMTALSFTDIAFAAGFGSVRQFNDTVREVFAASPSELRGRAGRGPARQDAASGPAVVPISMRLPVRPPFDATGLFAFLAARCVPGVEQWDGVTYRRSLRLPHGTGVAALTPGPDGVQCELLLADLRDLGAAVSRCRRLMDLDADPVSIDQHLGDDALLRRSVRAVPGVRSPGAVDGAEVAVRAVLGQQVSVAAARTLAGRLVAASGDPLPGALSGGGVTHLFPAAEQLARLGDDSSDGDGSGPGMPRARRRAVAAVCRAVADGTLDLEPGADRSIARHRLAAIEGVGPWTVEYVALRALADPDAFPAGDLVVRRVLGAAGRPITAGEATRRAEQWRPWRGYALHHLWRLAGAVPLPHPSVADHEEPT
jgi:AraC family transcriptional regulator of adaptative response / DNA-3-methyladenine glycosylase II